VREKFGIPLLLVMAAACFSAHAAECINHNIFNNGELGSIEICTGYSINIKNSGAIDSIILDKSTTSLTQIISDNSEITGLHVIATNGAKFFISVIDADEIINLDAVFSIAARADKIKITNSALGLTLGNSTPPAALEFFGNTVLIIDKISGGGDFLVLRGASHSGGTVVVNGAIDDLWNLASYWDGDDLRVRILRNTDYSFFMPGGNIVNAVAMRSSGHRTIRAMNRAANMNEISRIQKNSVMLNPINLARHLRAWSRMNYGDAMTRDIAGGVVGVMWDSDAMVESAAMQGRIGIFNAKLYGGAIQNDSERFRVRPVQRSVLRGGYRHEIQDS
jgi:hypothetical protein